jgi:hypothetical protein
MHVKLALDGSHGLLKVARGCHCEAIFVEAIPNLSGRLLRKNRSQ